MLKVVSLLAKAKREEVNSDQLQTLIEMKLAAEMFLSFYRGKERQIQKLNPTID